MNDSDFVDFGEKERRVMCDGNAMCTDTFIHALKEFKALFSNPDSIRIVSLNVSGGTLTIRYGIGNGSRNAYSIALEDIWQGTGRESGEGCNDDQNN
jgi:hypothetical protein